MKQYFAAIADYDTAIQLNPNDAKAYNNRGDSKDELGDHFAAIRDYDTAIRLNPNYEYALSCRRIVQGKLGNRFGGE